MTASKVLVALVIAAVVSAVAFTLFNDDGDTPALPPGAFDGAAPGDSSGSALPVDENFEEVFDQERRDALASQGEVRQIFVEEPEPVAPQDEDSVFMPLRDDAGPGPGQGPGSAPQPFRPIAGGSPMPVEGPGGSSYSSIDPATVVGPGETIDPNDPAIQELGPGASELDPDTIRDLGIDPGPGPGDEPQDDPGPGPGANDPRTPPPTRVDN